MTSLLAERIRAYTDGLLGQKSEIVHRQAAEQFIGDNPDLVDQHIAGLVENQITALLRKRAQSPSAPFGQGLLFAALPAAITVREGVTKPLRACTWADLEAGREFKISNIASAQQSLKDYDAELANLKPLMEPKPKRTIEQAARILANRSVRSA